nr:50S ribosomal protein L33 [Candidatus Gracilibacteria bacterium]
MAKGKRTYIGLYSEETGNLCYVTNIQKKNFGQGEKLTLRKYNKVTRKHEVLKMKEIKKG